MLLERRKDGQQFTISIQTDGPAVEDKLIIGTYLIDKEKWNSVLGCMASDNIVPDFLFPLVEGGSSDVYYQARTPIGHYLNRIIGVRARVP